MKLNIAILYGHLSPEHDISILTAVQVMKAIDTNKYNVIPIYITKDNKYITGKKLNEISNYPNNISGREVTILPNSNYLYKKSNLGLRKYIRIDVALLCFHGNYGENGAMQSIFEMNNIPYTSTGMIGSICGANKIVFKEIIKSNNIPTVNARWFSENDFYKDKKFTLDKISSVLGYPVIVKPNTLGSSIGINVANNENELYNALKTAFELDGNVLVEKFITGCREVNIAIMYDGYKYIYSEIEEVCSKDKFLTFNDKYMGNSNKSKSNSVGMYLGANIKAELNNEIKSKIIEYTKTVHNLLELRGIVRFDYLIDGEDIYLNEINTIPGSLANYLFESYTFTELIDVLINSAILNNSKSNKYIKTFDSSVLENRTRGIKG